MLSICVDFLIMINFIKRNSCFVKECSRSFYYLAENSWRKNNWILKKNCNFLLNCDQVYIRNPFICLLIIGFIFSLGKHFIFIFLKFSSAKININIIKIYIKATSLKQKLNIQKQNYQKLQLKRGVTIQIFIHGTKVTIQDLFLFLFLYFFFIPATAMHHPLPI